MEKYEPLGVVGEGSYGVVLKCRCRENGRIVAIKKFIDSEDDQNVRKIALREIRVLRKLRHENLVNLIEVFRRRKHIYLVFEFIDHTLLDQLEQKSHGLDEETCRKYIFQILRGLGFCHDNNIIHRDVKPENILVSKNGIVKLCDFGFARNLCGPGDVYTDYVATRWYRAPELLVGDVAYGKEVDIWAVGCLFAEMMTGEPLFPGDSDIDQLFLIAQCLGRLAKRHLNIMARNSAFRGFQYPKSRHGSTTSTGSSKFKYPEQQQQQQQPRNRSGSKMSVFSIMFPSWPDDAVVFLTLSLDPEPSARPTCSSLLRLPYFAHDNFPTRFLAEMNQKLQQEGRTPIKAFSKKQTQRIANVSPSVPMPIPGQTKHIQSSHPILRSNVSMDDTPPLKLQSLQSQNNNTSHNHNNNNSSSTNATTTAVNNTTTISSNGGISSINNNNSGSSTVNTNSSNTTSNTSSMSLSRQNTFIVETPLPNGNTSSKNLTSSSNNNNGLHHPLISNSIINNHTVNGKIMASKALSMEPQSRIPRKLSDEQLLVTPTVSLPLTSSNTTTATNNILPETINNPPNPLSMHFQTHPLSQQHANQIHSSSTNSHQHHPHPHQQETRRFSMSKKYSEQTDDRGGLDGLSMHMNINNNRQLPVTTLTFLGSNMFMASNAPAPISRSPNTNGIHHHHHSSHHPSSNLNSSSSHSLGHNKKSSISPKKSHLYTQSSNMMNKPIAFGSTVSNKESFLPRMKILDDNNSSFPFLALGSPSKPGTCTIRKDRDGRKWEPNQSTLSRKPSTTGLHDKSVNERPDVSREAPSTLPFM